MKTQQENLIIPKQRLFLSYAKEDTARVREIYDLLQAEGFSPWLDIVDLIPGQDWDSEIRKAIQGARLFLAFLSPHSVTKTGYFQREIKEALDVADSLPENKVYIVPVRLAECTVPTRVSKWQWIDIFSAVDYPKLIRAVRFHIGETETRKKRMMPAAVKPALRADREFVQICVDNGRLYHGISRDGRIALSDSRILMLRKSIGKMFTQLIASSGYVRPITASQIDHVLPTYRKWFRNLVNKKEAIADNMTRLFSSTGLSVVIDNKYFSILQGRYPKANIYIVGPNQPIVFGDANKKHIDAVAMPIRT